MLQPLNEMKEKLEDRYNDGTKVCLQLNLEKKLNKHKERTAADGE